MTDSSDSKNEPVNSPAQRSWLRRLNDQVFGFDFFISYRQDDGSTYAVKLANELSEHGFECCLDTSQYRIGENWKIVGYWMLRRTTCLVLVGSPGALESGPVLDEVRIFHGFKKRIVPIDFDGTLKPTPEVEADSTLEQSPEEETLLEYLPEEILRLHEKMGRLVIGPTSAVIAKIRGDFKGVRQDRRRIRLLGLATFILATAVALLVWTTTDAMKQRQRAEESRDEAIFNNASSMAAVAEREIDAGNVTNALKLGIEAIESVGTGNPHPIEAEAALIRALTRTREKAIWNLGGSPDISAASLRGELGLISRAEGGTDLVDIQNATIKQSLQSSGEPIWRAVFDETGSRIATIDRQGRLAVCEIDDLQNAQLLATTKGRAVVAAFGRDSTLVAGYEDGMIRVWDLVASKVTQAMNTHEGRVTLIAISADGNVAATASINRGTSLWLLATGTHIGSLDWHKAGVIAMQFSPTDVGQLVTASIDGTAIIWDTDKVKTDISLFDGTDDFGIDTSGSNFRKYRLPPEEIIAILRGHQSVVRSVRFDPSGGRIATASDDGTIRLWEAKSGALIDVLAGHDDAVVHADWIAGGKAIVSLSTDGTIRYWDSLSDPNPPIKLAQPGGYIPVWAHFADDREHVYTASEDMSINRWEKDGSSSSPIHIKGFPYVSGTGQRIYSADVDDDSTVIATSGCCMLGKVVEPSARGIQLRRFSDWNVTREILEEYCVRSLSFATKSKLLLVITASGNAILYDTNSDKVLQEFEELDGSVTSGVFGATRNTVALALSNGDVLIRRLKTGDEITIDVNDVAPKCIALSSNEEYLLTSSSEDTARLWSARSGTRICTLEGHSDGILSCTFSRDNRLALTTSWDHTARIWKVPSGKCIAILDRHDQAVHFGEFDRDSLAVATGSIDGFVRLWPVYSESSALVTAARDALPKSEQHLLSAAISKVTRSGTRLQKAEQRVAMISNRIRQWGLGNTNRATLKRAISALSKGDVDEAIAAFTVVIEATEHQIGRVLAHRGFARFRNADNESALSDLDRAVSYNSSYDSSYVFRAYVHERAGHYDKAVQDYSAAIELNPFSTRNFRGRAYAYRRQGLLEEAIQDITRAIEIAPSRSNYVGRAAIFQLNGQYQKAMSDYNRAAALEPTSAYLMHEAYKAFLLATCPDDDIRDGETAVTLIRKVMNEAKPGKTQIYSQALYNSIMAAAQAEVGNFNEAKRYQEMAIAQYRADGEDQKLPLQQKRLVEYQHERPCRERRPE